MERFGQVLIQYLWEIIPALAVGFLISGLVHELVPEDAVLEHMGRDGAKPILYSTLIGTLLPVCCWGSLPIAVSFHRKGAKLGPVLAFLVATPATSISALAVAYSIMGMRFTLFIFFAVIAIGAGVGFIGNAIPCRTPVRPDGAPGADCSPGCCAAGDSGSLRRKTVMERVRSVMRYAFWTLPADIGLEIVVGILLAAAVASILPVQHLVRHYLSGWQGYAFSLVFGVLTYLCSTASVPLVDSLIRQGLPAGAGMTLLLIGPVTSYGTMLVLRREFGNKVLAIFLAFLAVGSVLFGLVYQILTP
jgi:uncharacterized protein